MPAAARGRKEKEVKRSLEQKTRSKILQEQQKGKKEKLVSNDL